MNLLHEITPGTKEAINVIVEIPRGSNNKYEIDKATGLIKLDRVLHSAQTFPFDYGFVPQTLWDDDDALDVIILTTNPLMPSLLISARPVALLNMVDSGEADDKIIAVPIDDPRWESVRDLPDINKHTLKEITHFYATYKKLQNKEVEVKGFGNKEAAEAAFIRGGDLYTQKHSV